METPTPPIGSARTLLRLRKVYLLPNLLTAMNMFLGVLAIYGVLDERVTWSCWLIVLAGVLDTMDGAVARLTRSQSDFGLQFDSLSDLISFGVAPSLLAYDAIQDLRTDTDHHRLAMGICALFAVCGALRLARYNVQARGPERR